MLLGMLLGKANGISNYYMTVTDIHKRRSSLGTFTGGDSYQM